MELKNAGCRGEDHRGRAWSRDKREGMKGNKKGGKPLKTKRKAVKSRQVLMDHDAAMKKTSRGRPIKPHRSTTVCGLWISKPLNASKLGIKPNTY